MTFGKLCVLAICIGVVQLFFTLNGMPTLGVLVSGVTMAVGLREMRERKGNPATQPVAVAEYEDRGSDVAVGEGVLAWPTRPQREPGKQPTVVAPPDGSISAPNSSNARLRKLQRQRQRNYWK
jgi:hypothetical protein